MRRNKVGKKEVDLNEMVKVDPNELKEMCQFCMTKNSAAKVWNTDKFLQSEIPRLFKIVTALKLEVSSHLSPSLVCFRCESQMKMVAEIRLNFLRVAKFWKQHITQHTKITCIENVMDFENTALSAAAPFQVALIKCETESQHSEIEFIDDNRPSTSQQHPVEKNQIDYTMLSSFTSNGGERPPEILPFESFECEICGKVTKTKAQIRSHIEYHHKRSKNEHCPICNKANLKDLKRHMKDHQYRTDGNYSCSYCKRSFGRKSQMLQHQRQHTGDRPYICELCAFSFSSASGLQTHQKFQHINPNLCQQATRTVQVHRELIKPPELRPPNKIKEATLKLICPICSDTFANRSTLWHHFRGMHPVDNIKTIYKNILNVTCTICNQTFETAEQLIAHKIEHYKHKCTICSRGFENRLTLEYHRKTHSTKDRKHKCDECQKTFVRAEHMRAHKKRIHSTLRPYACSFCQRGFVEIYDLNLHVRKVHEVARPHQCTECPKSYKTVSLLRIHFAKHTGQHRYQCHMCNRPCHTGPLLSAHMKDFHPENEYD